MKNLQKTNEECNFLAKEIISEVDEKVKRTYWTNEQIDRCFGKRSADEIIQNKTTCFMNPCLDLTLVSASILSSREIPYILVIEEHLPTKEFNFNRLHFAIEFYQGNEKYVLNYKRINEVYISKGEYNGREDIPREQLIKISGENLSSKKTVYENLGYKSLEDLIKNKFKGYSLESNLNRLKRDNSKENYELYKQKFGDGFNIITKPENQL